MPLPLTLQVSPLHLSLLCEGLIEQTEVINCRVRTPHCQPVSTCLRQSIHSNISQSQNTPILNLCNYFFHQIGHFVRSQTNQLAERNLLLEQNGLEKEKSRKVFIVCRQRSKIVFGTTQRQMIYGDKNCRPCLKSHTYVAILQCSAIIVCSVVFQITRYHFALSDNGFLSHLFFFNN